MTKYITRSFLCMLFVLLACSSEDKISPTPNEPVPGTPVSDEERIAILEEVDDKVEQLDLSKFKDKIELMALLMQMQRFLSVGYLPESNAVYATFTDDRVVLFVNTPKTDELPGGRKGKDDGDALSNPSTARTHELPKSSRVSLFNEMGKYFGDNTVAIENIFKASKTKYTVERKTASVENLKKVGGDGVFYMFTHGGGGLIPNPPPRIDSTAVMSLWTTDPVTLENEKRYRDDLDTKKLAYMYSTYDTDKPVRHYGITGEFIKSYMSFADNAFIYIDACNSNRTRPTGVAFRNLVLDKAGNKKATYIGWTMETNEFMATRASQFIFDRLLGTNTTGSGATSIPKEDPIQRPFDFDRIFSDLQSRNFHLCANGATLKYDTRLEDDILLTPTIENIEVDEYTGILQIHGSFGNEKGKVTVNGSEITDIMDWTPGQINCTIPETGTASAGDVIVSVNDRQSNAVPLTRWNIKLNYATDDNGVRLEGVINLVIRGDVHKRRTKPGEDPAVVEAVDYGPVSGHMFGNASNATYHIGGQKLAQCKMEPCTSTFTETPLVKSGTVPYMPLASGVSALLGFYNWTPDLKTIKLDFLTVSLVNITSTHISAKYACPKSNEEIKSDVVTSMGISFPVDQSLEIIKLEVANNYNISAGSFSKTIPRPWSLCNDSQGSYKVLVTWEFVRPEFAPDDVTAARE